ncbi:MAG TPA: hypothetical protein VG649_11685, partial [Candidatus Angelobacter sp.]|nr:hypothetical protein [Candidatus Angelobacter sp.]
KPGAFEVELIQPRRGVAKLAQGGAQRNPAIAARLISSPVRGDQAFAPFVAVDSNEDYAGISLLARKPNEG